MSDLVPDHPTPHPLASVPDGLTWPEAREWVKAKKPETYRGPYGEFPVPFGFHPTLCSDPYRNHAGLATGGGGHSPWRSARTGEMECSRCRMPMPWAAPDNSDPGDEQPEACLHPTWVLDCALPFLDMNPPAASLRCTACGEVRSSQGVPNGDYFYFPPPPREQPEPSAVADKCRADDAAPSAIREQRAPSSGLMQRTGFRAPDDSEYGDTAPKWTDAIGMVRDRLDAAEIAAHKIAQLEGEVARLKMLGARYVQETQEVRAVNEQLRRERVEVEQAVGRLVHEGQLGSAVRLALHAWADSEARRGSD